MIVDVSDLVLLCIILKHRIELHDLFSRFLHFRSPSVVLARKYRADDRLDLVGLGYFTHGNDVSEDVLQCYVAVVECDVVCAGKNYNVFRMKVYDVLSETYDHM